MARTKGSARKRPSPRLNRRPPFSHFNPSHVMDSTAKTSPLPTDTGPIPSFIPQSVVSWISESSGQPMHTLSRITIREGLSVFNAILDYAYMCSDPNSTNMPLDVEGENNHPHYEREHHYNELFSDGSSEDVGEPVGRNEERRRLIRLRSVCLPVLRMGYGQMAVYWPPPPHLNADVLAENDRKVQEKLEREADREDAEANEIDGNQTVEEKEVLEDLNGLEKLETKIEEGDGIHNETVERHVLYIAHFLDIGNGKNLLVSTTAGIKVLEQFAQDVVTWNEMRVYIPGQNSIHPNSSQMSPSLSDKFFEFYRLTIDEEGVAFWKKDQAKRCRSPKSVILSDNKMETVIDDVRSFLKGSTRKWYIDHGLPVRRSFLFYGSPGTGKTSAIKAIASQFQLSVCMMGFTGTSFSNQSLAEALADMPRRAMLVLEDVDALFDGRNSRTGQHSLTFSGVLNALDGMVSAEGVITIMTTNHTEKLDAALLRGGRVDRRFFFNVPTDQQIKDFFLSFYPEAEPGVANNFLAEVIKRPAHENARSMPSLQELFISTQRQSAEECVKAVAPFFDNFVPLGANE